MILPTFARHTFATRATTLVLGLVLAPAALALAAGAGGNRAPKAPPADRVDAAVAAAADYLWTLYADDHWDEQATGAMPRDHGGRTALCVYALLSAGESYQSEPMADAIEWLAGAEVQSVYARSFRVLALSEIPDRAASAEVRRTILADSQWLLAAARPDGAYDYLASTATGDGWDNSNTQAAHLAVWTAAQRGLAVRPEYWRRAEQHWLRTQTGPGGWSYGSARRPPYGSMTAAGLASLLVCYDELHQSAARGEDAGRADRAIAGGVAWLGKNFTAWENPGRGPQYYFYYLWAVERAGRASGYAFFGDHDWFAEGAGELLRTQSRDGGWGDLVDTCFALTFLAHGSQPILFSKLKYDGVWNARPRDMANLTRWLGRRFERPVRWQIVDIDSPIEQWRRTPILYISGASTPRFTAAHIARLRRYAEAGGLILSEAAGNSPAFNVAMRKMYATAFADRRLEPIDPSHPVFRAHRELRNPIRLSGVDNGVRLLAIHSPGDLSNAWQRRDTARRGDVFQLAANMYFHATDFGAFGRHRLPPAERLAPAAKPTRVIPVALLSHAGNSAPEPMAYDRLAAMMAQRYAVALEYSEPLAIADLPADRYPIALMTGTEAFTLSAADRSALRAFIDAGGLLVADAAGGSDAFDKAATEQLLTLLDDVYPKVGRLPTTSKVYRQPGRIIGKVAYRRASRTRYGDDRAPRLQAVSIEGRPAIVYSHDDLTAGLVGYYGHNLRGYAPDSAFEIMRNLLLYAADRPKPRPPGESEPTP